MYNFVRALTKPYPGAFIYLSDGSKIIIWKVEIVFEADAGDIIAQKAFPILLNDDCDTVYKKSARAGAELISEFLPKISAGCAPRTHNPSKSYPAYPKRTPDDGEIDFQRSAIDVYNFIRALTKPYPGAFTYLPDGAKIVIWKAEIVFDESRLANDDIFLTLLI